MHSPILPIFTVEEFLNQLYLLYQKSLKRLRELQRIAEAWDNPSLTLQRRMELDGSIIKYGL